jgi:VCBS repeat-containing protein
VEFAGLSPFDKVVLGSSSNAFEIDNISAGTVSAPHVELAAPITGTISVSDADVGDTLTASVTGDAVITYNGYNGSTTLPANVSVAALKAASAVTFDSVHTNGGVNVLHWTYDPTNPDLDFLKSGDTLTITFKHRSTTARQQRWAVKELTITIGGANPSADMSEFKVVKPDVRKRHVQPRRQQRDDLRRSGATTRSCSMPISAARQSATLTSTADNHGSLIFLERIGVCGRRAAGQFRPRHGHHEWSRYAHVDRRERRATAGASTNRFPM